MRTNASQNQKGNVSRRAAGSAAAYRTASPGQLMLDWAATDKCSNMKPEVGIQLLHHGTSSPNSVATCEIKLFQNYFS